ncbi:NB-ARC domain-containing protein [Streptomyces kunmingensis]|uniref:NB-ARC domain-containing protein n=1 Tax=Streptomyces kunmingensis TaxID=68225 RepID=A0ABU6CD95_9ACTN|nr:NB-ARC domain-containing protein [Streptomyces kunmingensis]MEB3962151.1 NB-ARC domain-containing protein [Streptomyces kunmingensis]
MAADKQRERRAGELPRATGQLVGRRTELAQVAQALQPHRMVTLVGVGGVGKTRVAQSVAAQLQPELKDGAWWVALSGLRDGELLPHAIAEALPMAHQTAVPVIDALAHYLAQRNLLLVLDTCEHLTRELRPVVERLIGASPGLRILATSRRPLGVAAEELLTVEPLPVPGPGTGPERGPAEGPETDAMVLLAERAADAVPGFTVTASGRADLERLCRQLEGLPLAIELAAARLRELSPAELADRLADRVSDRFSVLGDGDTTAEANTGLHPDTAAAATGDVEPIWHQALRTAIGWSHQLCTPAERLLWARLSVFVGSFDMEGAVQVCGDDRLDPKEIPQLLAGLAEKSIITWEPTAAGERYRMLDTIREYGEGWLRSLGEGREFRRRHRTWYLRLARDGDAAWMGPDQYAWYERMHAELDNLRLALDSCLGSADTRIGLGMAGDLWFLWYACGLAREGRHYLERALAAFPGPSPLRLKALYAYGLVLTELGDLPALEECSAECTALAARFGEAEDSLAKSVTVVTAALRGDAVTVLKLTDELHARHSRSPEAMLSVPGLGSLSVGSHARIAMGMAEEALVGLDEMRQTCDTFGESWMRAWGDSIRAQAELALGRIQDAELSARASLTVKHRMHDSFGSGMCLEAIAQCAIADGEAERAARLLGLAHQLWDALGRPQVGIPTWVAAHEDCVGRTREALGDPAYDRAFHIGYRTDLDAGIAQALGGAVPT